MRAVIKFNKGMLKMPIHWQLWLMLLVTVNLVVPLFYLRRLEAEVGDSTPPGRATLLFTHFSSIQFNISNRFAV